MIFNSLPEENYHTARRVISCLNKVCMGDKNLFQIITLFFHKCFFNFPIESNLKMNKSVSFDIFSYMIENSDRLPHRFFKRCLNVLKEKNYYHKTDNLLTPVLLYKEKSQRNSYKHNNRQNMLKKKQIFSNSIHSYSPVNHSIHSSSHSKKIDNTLLALEHAIKHLDLKDHLNCRMVCKKWNRFFTESESINQFFYVDFQILLDWYSNDQQIKLAQNYQWLKKCSNESKTSRFLLFSSLITFHSQQDLQNLKLNNHKKHLKIAISGNKSSGKSLFLSHLGSFINYLSIKQTELGVVLEGKGKLGDSQQSNFLVSITELESSKLIESLTSKKLQEFDAIILIVSPEKKENFESIHELDCSLKETLKENNNSETKFFRVLNKIDLLKDTKIPNLKIQSGHSKISLDNYFPISVEKKINLESFFPFIFQTVLK